MRLLKWAVLLGLAAFLEEAAPPSADQYAMQGLFRQALPAYRTLAQASPSDAANWMKLALAQLMTDDPKAAVRSLTAASKADRAVVSQDFYVGLTAWSGGRAELAATALQKAVERAPDDLALRQALADVLFESDISN